MRCHQCGACCIAPSISSPVPGMPRGKIAGIRCLHLNDDNKCTIHGTDQYPSVCSNYTPTRELCGETFSDALNLLSCLETRTSWTHEV